MSRTDRSFDALRQAIQSLWLGDESNNVDVATHPGLLLLTLPNDRLPRFPCSIRVRMRTSRRFIATSSGSIGRMTEPGMNGHCRS